MNSGDGLEYLQDLTELSRLRDSQRKLLDGQNFKLIIEGYDWFAVVVKTVDNRYGHLLNCCNTYLYLIVRCKEIESLPQTLIF